MAIAASEMQLAWAQETLQISSTSRLLTGRAKRIPAMLLAYVTQGLTSYVPACMLGNTSTLHVLQRAAAPQLTG